jgi:hypothetical protein
MKLPSITIDIHEAPPSHASVSAAHAAVKQLSLKVSGLCTALIGIALVGFLALQLHLYDGIVAQTAYVVGLVGFFVTREFEHVISRRLAAVSPVPDSVLAEAALLSSSTPATREYRDALRKQKREMTLAEFDAMKQLVAATPVNASRETLYG